MKGIKTNNKGFSLVELIIVIAIMAILVAVLAPQYLKYVDRSRYSRDVQTVDQLYTAIQAAMADPNAILPADATNNTGVEIKFTLNNTTKKFESDKLQDKLEASAGADNDLFTLVSDSFGGALPEKIELSSQNAWSATDGESKKHDLPVITIKNGVATVNSYATENP